ncbi:hypothetical protein MHB50_20945 [Siminovitchia sp. FSL H7-0308]|uniref:hypothetical protein n=1 Tax=Siminovitchia sp. FSL H7-0308 TaxID=2921432 RepID=UPI0030EC6967
MEISLFLTILVIISGLVVLSQSIKDIVIKRLFITIGVVIIFMKIFSHWMTYDRLEYTHFTSPDGKEEFLVIESYVSELYQITKNPFLIEHLSTIRGYRGFQPFHRGSYKLEWIDPNTLKVSYLNRCTSEEYIDVLIEYKKEK